MQPVAKVLSFATARRKIGSARSNLSQKPVALPNSAVLRYLSKMSDILPLNLFRLTSFAHARVGELLRSEGGEGTFIVGAFEQDRYASVLTGRYAGHAFPLRDNQPRTGLAIAGLSVEADADSWTEEWRAPGNIIAGTQGAILVANAKVGHFDETIYLGLTEPVPANFKAREFPAFTRWSLVHIDEFGRRAVVYHHGAERP